MFCGKCERKKTQKTQNQRIITQKMNWHEGISVHTHTHNTHYSLSIIMFNVFFAHTSVVVVVVVHLLDHSGSFHSGTTQILLFAHFVVWHQ